MLPARARLRSRSEFTAVVRRGRRAARGSLLAHALTGAAVAPAGPATEGDAASTDVRFGFLVGRNVGGAVQRNRVRRRLRHLARTELPALPPGSALVIRALPPAGERDSTELGRDLRAVLAAALGSRQGREVRPGAREPGR